MVVLWSVGHGQQRFVINLRCCKYEYIMNRLNLKEISLEDLQKQLKGHKTLFGIFIPIILALIFFLWRDYSQGEGLDWATLTIIICSIGGAVTVYSELRKVQEEMKSRERK